MWLALLSKILIEIIPKVIDQIGKSGQHGLMAADNSEAVHQIRTGLAEAQMMLNEGE